MSTLKESRVYYGIKIEFVKNLAKIIMDGLVVLPGQNTSKLKSIIRQICQTIIQ